MKTNKIILLIVMMALISSFFVSADVKLSNDVKTRELFSGLKVNDAENGEAIFTINIVEKALAKESFRLTFNEVCGHVKSYVFQINDNCSEQIPVYEVDDNVTKIIGYNNETFECFKEVSELPIGMRDYKIKADIERGLCSDGFMGYRIDWQPSIVIGGTEYKKDDWAWWNATGGTTIYDGLYTVHTFTSNGTFVVTGSQGWINLTVLVVAGGGGGGSLGGGAGGGVIYNTSYNASGNISVVVGVGGNGSKTSTDYGTNGTYSSFGALNATGGGGGGAYSDTYQNGNNGGSGGGGGAKISSPYTHGTGGTGTGGQGYEGGEGDQTNNACGGGGGGGSLTAGMNATVKYYGGTGGNGTGYSINGTNVSYGAGGGGASYNAVAIGGLYGGGNGSKESTSTAATSGINGSGGGGGGCGAWMTGACAGSGGSGIVIVRYLTYSSNIANESAAREAILAGIASSEIASSYSSYADKQAYIRLINDSQYKGTFDEFVVSGDAYKRWAFNYDQNASSDFPVFFNITPVLYVWQNYNMTYDQIMWNVSQFINDTYP
jgi:hypothetical protein